VLLDNKMPKVGGLEVLKIIKADEGLKTIPVVALTSSREPRDLAEFYKHGANAYVVKAADFAEFTEAVKLVGLFWVGINESPPLVKREATAIPAPEPYAVTRPAPSEIFHSPSEPAVAKRFAAKVNTS
jgi:CheY-like chemotaxis protein